MVRVRLETQLCRDQALRAWESWLITLATVYLSVKWEDLSLCRAIVWVKCK